MAKCQYLSGMTLLTLEMMFCIKKNSSGQLWVSTPCPWSLTFWCWLFRSGCYFSFQGKKNLWLRRLGRSNGFWKTPECIMRSETNRSLMTKGTWFWTVTKLCRAKLNLWFLHCGTLCFCCQPCLCCLPTSWSIATRQTSQGLRTTWQIFKSNCWRLASGSRGWIFCTWSNLARGCDWWIGLSSTRCQTWWSSS